MVVLWVDHYLLLLERLYGQKRKQYCNTIKTYILSMVCRWHLKQKGNSRQRFVQMVKLLRSKH